MRREIVADHENEGKLREHTGRLEIGHRIVGQIRKQRRVHRHAGGKPGLQRVAVRRRARGGDSACERAGAGKIFDHKGLAELLGKLLAKDA